MKQSHKKGYAIATVIVAILLVAALPYYAPPTLRPVASVVSDMENNISAWTYAMLHPTSGTSPPASTTQQSNPPNQQTSTVTSQPGGGSQQTTTVSQTQTTTQSQSLARFAPSLPDFVNDVANVTFPADYQVLANYSLSLINADRASSGLKPVTLSSVSSGQQHSDSMLYYGYFSHWDVQGYKPYMRYTMLGGTGYVAENAGLTYCTTSPPQSALLTLASCTLQTLKNGLAASEWGMMYDDAAQGNGHRDNILDPSRSRVSIGVAYDTLSGKVYFVEDFEDAYLQLVTPLVSGSEVTLKGTMSPPLTLEAICVFYDPIPASLSASALGGAAYSDGYGQGTFAGGVLPDANSYYPGSVTVHPESWTVTADSINISFSLAQFVQQYGGGVYTIYVQTNSGTSSYVTSLSVFVG